MRKAWALAAGVAGLVLTQMGPAVAATSGTESWTIVSHGGHPTHVSATGVFNASGTVVDNVIVDPVHGTFSNTAVQTFRDGTLTFTDAGSVTLDVDPDNCHAEAQLAAPFTITDGSGAYAGATGLGTLSGHLTFIYRHSKQGCLFPSAVSPGELIQTLGVAKAEGHLNIP